MCPKATTRDGSHVRRDIPQLHIECEDLEAVLSSYSKSHFGNWMLHSSSFRDYFESDRSDDQKMPLLQWYQLNCNGELKLFNSLKPQERAHDPDFLKAWAAGITKVFCVPPKPWRSYFVRSQGFYTLTCIPSLGVLRWLASKACCHPRQIVSVWNVPFKTVCKYNPYLLSLLAIAGDMCFPFQRGRKVRPSRGRGVKNPIPMMDVDPSVHLPRQVQPALVSDSEPESDFDPTGYYSDTVY